MPCLSGKVDKRVQKQFESEYNVMGISEGRVQCFIQLLFWQLEAQTPGCFESVCDSCQRPVSERFSENLEYLNPEMKETLGY